MHKQADIIKKEENSMLKTTPANSISLEDSYGETYQGDESNIKQQVLLGLCR